MLVLQEKRFGHDHPGRAGRRLLTLGQPSEHGWQHGPELARDPATTATTQGQFAASLLTPGSTSGNCSCVQNWDTELGPKSEAAEGHREKTLDSSGFDLLRPYQAKHVVSRGTWSAKFSSWLIFPCLNTRCMCQAQGCGSFVSTGCGD